MGPNHVIHMDSLDETIVELQELLTEIVSECTPIAAGQLIDPSTSGFRTLSVNWNLVHRRFDVALARIRNGQFVFFTCTGSCPAGAVASLFVALGKLTSVDLKAIDALPSPAEVHFTFPDDNENAAHPF